MEDGFDDLDIPDDWLDLERGCKRRSEDPGLVVEEKKGRISDTGIIDSDDYEEITFPDSGQNTSVKTVELSSTGLHSENNNVVDLSDIDEHSEILAKEDATDLYSDNYDDDLNDPEFYDSYYSEGSLNEDLAGVSSLDEEASIEESKENHITISSESSTLEDDTINEPTVYTGTAGKADKQEDMVNLFEEQIPKKGIQLQLYNVAGTIRNTPTLPVLNGGAESSSNVSKGGETKPQNTAGSKASTNVNEYLQETSRLTKPLENSNLMEEAQTISSIVPNHSIEEIYNCLINNRDIPNRMDFVIDKMLEQAPAGKESTTEDDIFKEVKHVLSAVPHADPNVIYALLESHPPSAERSRIIISQLNPAFVEGTSIHVPGWVNGNVSNANTPVNLSAYRNVDFRTNTPNKTNDLNESLIPAADKLGNVNAIPARNADPNPPQVPPVVNPLKPNLLPQPPLMRKESSVTDPFLKEDIIFHEMRTIAKMFPDRDRNEIYAMLEANRYNSNRLQVVVEEIVRLGGDGSQAPDTPGPATQTPEENNNVQDTEHLFEQHLENLKGIFPDCDPNYLYEKLHSIKNHPDRVDVLATQLFEKRDYPKIKSSKDTAEQQRELVRKQRLRNLELTQEEFKDKFPDPQKSFVAASTDKSRLHHEHGITALVNEFPMLRRDYLRNTLAKHRGHFYLTYQEISAMLLNVPIEQRRRHDRFMKRPRSGKLPMPAETDEMFYYEYWFVRNELTMKDYEKKKEEERTLKVETARAKGELYECCCCYDDECLFEDLTGCPEGHLFCKTCLVRSTEAAFGEMKTKFPCLTGECKQNIPLRTLEAIIPAKLFSNILLRIQEEEVLQANIADLVVCPFCPFATIMDNPDDKVFKCLNPQCLKESCRLCQEPNHIPLRCNEVEKKSETTMRTFIENYISDAVMRKCHKCGKRFIKEVGCNMMTCVCRATSCYACKEQNITYDHFNKNKSCADTDPVRIHKRNMMEAAQKAKEEYLRLHPEASEVELKTDVNALIRD